MSSGLTLRLARPCLSSRSRIDYEPIFGVRARLREPVLLIRHYSPLIPQHADVCTTLTCRRPYWMPALARRLRRRRRREFGRPSFRLAALRKPHVERGRRHVGGIPKYG